MNDDECIKNSGTWWDVQCIRSIISEVDQLVHLSWTEDHPNSPLSILFYSICDLYLILQVPIEYLTRRKERKVGIKEWMTFSLRTSWMREVSFEMLLMISEVFASWESNKPTSCLSTAFKYLYRILSTCLSPVLLQQYPSAFLNITVQLTY